MNLEKYFLLSILYFWASSTSLSFGVGYYTLYRPVITGLLTGIVLGRPYVGMAAGAVVNILYMDFVSTGGSLKADQCLTAIISAVSSVLLGLTPVEALAVAYPFGYLGTLIWKYRLKINTVFVKKYDNAFSKKINPDITLYNGFMPQILLYVVSTVIAVPAVIVVTLLGEYIYGIRNALYLAGFFLIFTSMFYTLYKMDKKSNLIFIFLFMSMLIMNFSSYIIFAIFLFVLAYLSDKNLISTDYNKAKKSGIISKTDLFYSWAVWMNFSHSCYSFERMQGMAYAQSMKRIFRKLYGGSDAQYEAVHRHSAFFNTEPNIGTPIHGYIISLEENNIKNNSDEKNVMFMKKGMMGIAAGMGDSYTQVVLTPLFISMSVLLCLDGRYIASIIPVIMLALIILAISYTGFMKGYYLGRESLIERINIVKNSKIKFYFSYIFSGILGSSLGRLLTTYNLSKNLTVYLLIGIISLSYVTVKIKRSLNQQ
ncbi:MULTISPECIES: PTS system mannose/fructose/sorbose family transporter subunit IID [unclassified Sedimentibacter]|uniref:PTS system mannose/fructose/sorbose family transporter subunit IID n=1 Tax=unclassified Sedimentibacter TaxID=2649220 RepID=UPI0027E1224D|nr:PTS system mannose/fructose/sorbose family transporter subunit IID [Sedimentibacter sp. MB35-C1]WMJ75856.1 PTS system mannose/fructose/sorbose family transporter subunit IID [Sedimentibacter sp. MB35-C1]